MYNIIDIEETEIDMELDILSVREQYHPIKEQEEEENFHLDRFQDRLVR